MMRGPLAGGVRWATAVALAAATAALPREAAGQWRAIPVSGGPDAVAAAGGLAPGLPAWRVLYEAARRRHGLWGEDAGFSVARAAGGSWAGEVALPPGPDLALPLGPDLWRGLLRRADVPDDALALAILEDRRASLVYRGLAALDDATLAALADSETLRELHDRHAEPFAALCGRFRVSGGAVVLPGGPGAEPLWTDLVGEGARTPTAFLLALLAPSGGRRALLFDAIAGLDAAHQRFALSEGLALPERKERFRALAAAFDREPAWWRREGGAFRRPEADAGRLLREVRLDREGALAPPAAQAFWKTVFEGGAPPAGEAFAREVRGSPAADAAWLAQRMARGGAADRRVRLSQLLFAQRVFGEAREEALADAARGADGLRDVPALVLFLERLGSRDPSLYGAAVTAARLAARAADGERRERVLRGFQGALGVIDRARFSGTLDVGRAERLVRSLVALPVADERAWGAALAGWLGTELLATLRESERGAALEGSPDAVILCGMAGDVVRLGEGAEPQSVHWGGLRYEVDAGRTERRRLERVRARQGGESLGAALSACARTEEGKEGRCADALGRALTALVYASHLGDPEGPALAGEDPSLRHDFGSEPWGLPAESFGPGVPWHATGSLLGLERALGELSLHRLAGDAVPEDPPVVDAALRRRLAAAAALVNPRDLDDAGRDALARAIEEGRRRVASLRPGDRGVVEAVIRDSGVEPWRGRSFAWLLEHEAGARDSFFSLVELVRLGGAEAGRWDAWGATDLVAAGLRPRLPPPEDPSGRRPEDALEAGFADLGLRVASHLGERRLPATLAPSLVRTLLPDLFVEARPLAPDDRLGLEAWVRGLDPDRLDDAVSSLAGRGPLLPAPGRERVR